MSTTTYTVTITDTVTTTWHVPASLVDTPEDAVEIATAWLVDGEGPDDYQVTERMTECHT